MGNVVIILFPNWPTSAYIICIVFLPKMKEIETKLQDRPRHKVVAYYNLALLLSTVNVVFGVSVLYLTI